MPKFIDLTGQKFKRLTVIKRAENSAHGKAMFHCKCICGNFTIAIGSNLTNNFTSSCGCFHNEVTSKINKTHGLSNTPEYETWCDMKARCYNKMNINHLRYGARGIILCERWKNSFENFISDMGNRPTNKHTIDRIDNNGNYEPRNCKWSTRAEQANNKNNNRILTYKGTSRTVSQWSSITGINESTIRSRVKRYNWPIAKALDYE